MIATAQNSIAFPPRLLLLVAIAALVVIGLATWFEPAVLWPAWRFGVFVGLAPAIGSMIFALIHRLTGGKWGGPLEPSLLAGCRLAPWLWLLTLPLIFVGDAHATWPHYESRGMLLLRGLLYALVLFLIARRLTGPKTRAPSTGPAGFIVLVFMLHFLAEDWLGALELHWHSTAFPLVWMTGVAVAGLAYAVLTAIVVLPSSRPQTAAHGLDWGNLLLAAMLFWCYVAFAQFLIIWAGNLPREISWFVRRTQGAWALVPPALALIHFFLPFAVLLSRDAKRSPGLLASVAAILLLGQIVYTAWLILPAFSLPGLGPVIAAFVAPLAALGLFSHRYLAAAIQRGSTV
jgi:hypothetical protein